MFIRPGLRTIKSRYQQAFQAGGTKRGPFQVQGTVWERGTRQEQEKTAELMLLSWRLSATIPKDILQSKSQQRVIYYSPENRLRGWRSRPWTAESRVSKRFTVNSDRASPFQTLKFKMLQNPKLSANKIPQVENSTSAHLTPCVKLGFIHKIIKNTG